MMLLILLQRYSYYTNAGNRETENVDYVSSDVLHV